MLTHPRWIYLLIILLAGFTNIAPSAYGQTVNLPITLEYPLLQTLITNSAFPEPGQRRTLVNEADGCLYLALSEPRLTEHTGLIRLEMKVSAQAGTPLGGSCFGGVGWQGYLVFFQQPHINPGSWQLTFSTESTQLLGANRQPETISQILWSFIEPRVISYLDTIVIDLKVPVNDLKSFMLPLFPAQVAAKTEQMLDSMRPGPVDIKPEHVQVEILTEVQEVYDPAESTTPHYLDGDALAQYVKLWENWDSMLTHLVTMLAAELLNEEEQMILIDVLLETRHRFIQDLSDKTITNDFVREQFVEAWKQLSPIFRNHLYKKQENSQLLGYLAFVSSSDALLVFDSLGPTFGLEISKNGLLRLMYMLSADPQLLKYPRAINPDLQKLFQLDTQSDSNTKLLDSILELISPPSAIAAALPTFQQILEWQVPKKDIGKYIDRVDGVLRSSTRQVMEKKEIPAKQTEMFKKLIPAMAWQESCYRQFVIRNDKLTYLLSYNNSSVGLMQVNERVWRGIYDRERLRWDINYNSRAGCEIAALYLKKYGLRDKKKASELTHRELAGLVYALYNGGPSQYQKYLKRLATRKFYDSDNLFGQKYDWVTGSQKNELSKCLIGG